MPLLTVEENVFLGQWPVRRGGLVDWSATRSDARRVLGDLGVSIDPAAEVRALRPAEQTLVEIAKGLSHEMRVLLLDEPTSTISEEETSRLFGILRRLRGMGVGIDPHLAPDPRHPGGRRPDDGAARWPGRLSDGIGGDERSRHRAADGR